MLLPNLTKTVLDTITLPVNYDNISQTIKDANGVLICDVRGWGKIQFMDKAEERHDAIGYTIAELLNGLQA
ncbi:hypothetical protein [Zunongwangia sp.]|uniref:hypothetical protein n=1 Tax=Zunongwangia sp. TaxID=1965325 RepID=UPI003AA88F1B